MAVIDPKLSSANLRKWILDSLSASGRNALILSSPRSGPVRVLLGGLGDEEAVILRIYARNVTHGGGPARAADEYRIQLTGEMPRQVAGEITIVLGWSEKFKVFAGWDASVHTERESSSPSLQIRAQTLTSAKDIGLAAAIRHSDDVVVAFRAELLAIYCLNAFDIHNDSAADIVDVLNAIPSSTDSDDGDEPLEQAPASRKKVARTIESNYRAWDFSLRVKKAYGDRCAVCATQLDLNEAAHIVPVAWPGSTDQTSNGLLLCRNHHRAYDAKLLSVTKSMMIEISKSRGKDLENLGKDGGLVDLMAFDGQILAVVPDSMADKPKPKYLQLGRDARRWAQ